MSQNPDEQKGGLSDDVRDVREQAVHEYRHWVRTTYACNNRCIFCLDGDVSRARHLPKAEVFAEIERGFQPGARLIVSGGEASIHPDFIDFVAHGKRVGYGWIQTITNGRMFAYEPFTRKAADAGLNEVTFSMHGHTSEIHDTLTGIKGGFAQALRGMRNLLKDGRVVINVDCVINGLNYKHLDDILQFYMKLGIHEFDLLQIVPFGRAWYDENRERLFYDVEEAFPYLNRAFQRAYKPGNYIWTNRFPVAYLEGIEDLIQDPHKLFDEMRGRRDEFEHFVDSGQKLRCFGERCRYCFLQDYCDTLHRLHDRLSVGGFARVAVDLVENDNLIAPSALKAQIEKSGIRRLRLSARDATQAREWMSRMDGFLPDEIELSLDDWTAFLDEVTKRPPVETWPGLRRLVVMTPDALDALSALDIELEIPVLTDLMETLNGRKHELAERGRVWLRWPTVETLNEARAQVPDPAAFLADWQDVPVKVLGVPLCLHPGAETDPPTLRLSSLDVTGRLDMPSFTRDYIRFDYEAKSNRCRNCAQTAACRGLHLNTLRVHGFKTLRPFE